MLKRIPAVFSTALMIVVGVCVAIGWPRDGRLFYPMCIAGPLSFLYLLFVTDKSVKLKLDEYWGKFYDGIEKEERSELDEHLDNLQDAVMADDGVLIVECRESIRDIVAELQLERRNQKR